MSRDFVTQNWMDCLLSAGIDASVPTLFVWEGASMYLLRNVVKETLPAIATILIVSGRYKRD